MNKTIYNESRWRLIKENDHYHLLTGTYESQRLIRIWKNRKTNPKHKECLAAIELYLNQYKT